MRRLLPALLLALLLVALEAAPAAARGTAFFNERVVSPDGRTVVFESGDRLVAEDTDDHTDVYAWHDGEPRLVSTGPFTDPTPSGWGMNGLYVSEDGRRVIFETSERLIAADVDESIDVYERHRGKTQLLTTGPTDPGTQLLWDWPYEQGVHYAGQSADGAIVYFDTRGAMVAADDDAVRDVYKSEGGVTTLVSTDANGHNAGGDHFFDAASTDGARIITSTLESLVSEDSDGGARDSYAYEAGRVELVTKGSLPGGESDADVVLVSPDARSVVFDTWDALEPNDLDGVIRDLYQRRGSTTRLISVGNTGAAVGCSTATEDPRRLQACDPTHSAQTDDGAHVLFNTPERLDSADTNVANDLYDRSGGRTTRVSVGFEPHDRHTYHEVAISPDASRVLFTSDARLVPEDIGLGGDVYERSGGQTRLISAHADGRSAGGELIGGSRDAARALFETSAEIDPADTDLRADLYLRAGGTTRRVSTGPSDANGDDWVRHVGHSSDALSVYFLSRQRLTADDTDDSDDLYRWFDGTTELISQPG